MKGIYYIAIYSYEGWEVLWEKPEGQTKYKGLRRGEPDGPWSIREYKLKKHIEVSESKDTGTCSHTAPGQENNAASNSEETKGGLSIFSSC